MSEHNACSSAPVDNLVVLNPGGLVTRDQQRAIEALDRAIAGAIKTAKASGAPLGLIVSVIHAYDFLETQNMVTRT